MSHARTKQQRLELAKRLLLIHHQKGIRDVELARELGVAYNSAWRYRRELGAVPVSPGRFKLIPTQEDIELARAVLETAGAHAEPPQNQNNRRKLGKGVGRS
jgi:hypothetical protein